MQSDSKPVSVRSLLFVFHRWVNDNSAGLLYVNDPRVLLVKLEELSAKPRSELPKILRHVGVPSTWASAARIWRKVFVPPSRATQAASTGMADSMGAGEAEESDADGAAEGYPLRGRAWRPWSQGVDLLDSLIRPSSGDHHAGVLDRVGASTSFGRPTARLIRRLGNKEEKASTKGWLEVRKPSIKLWADALSGSKYLRRQSKSRRRGLRMVNSRGSAESAGTSLARVGDRAGLSSSGLSHQSFQREALGALPVREPSPLASRTLAADTAIATSRRQERALPESSSASALLHVSSLPLASSLEHVGVAPNIAPKLFNQRKNSRHNALRRFQVLLKSNIWMIFSR